MDCRKMADKRRRAVFDCSIGNIGSGIIRRKESECENRQEENDMEKINVMVVDDSYETRSNIKQLLSFSKNIKVAAEAGSGEEAIMLANEMKPDVILMDITCRA